MKTNLNICYSMGVIGPIHAYTLVGGSVFVSPHEPRLVDSALALAHTFNTRASCLCKQLVRKSRMVRQAISPGKVV